MARAAGVARSTISKALRDDPTIPAARCAEIKRIAKKLGYSPNPMISALMAKLHHQRRRSDPCHIGWIDLWPTGQGPATVPILAPLLQGARQRARELGFDIEVHRVVAKGIRPERLRQMLTARSQWGLIIPPVPQSTMSFPLDMRGLTGVTIGTSLHAPTMHRVSPNHYQGAQLACDQLRARGCRRIGLALSRTMDERVEGKWLGAYAARQFLWPEKDRARPLLFDVAAGVDPAGKPISGADEAAFRTWIRRERLDGLLLAEPTVAAWAVKARDVLSPSCVAWLVLEPKQTNVRGIDYRAEQIGAAAVELVVGQIHRNERGNPAAPHTVLLDGVWEER